VKTLTVFCAAALLPAMAGPLDATPERLTMVLCSGGSLTIELPGRVPPPPGSGPCCAKGCQSGSSRKRFDRAQ